MRCPKCGAENPEDAKSCSSCGKILVTTTSTEQETMAKTSALAITSLVLWFFSILLFIMSIGLQHLSMSLISSLTGISAIICGIVALVEIKKSAGKLKGKELAISCIIFSVIFLFVLFEKSLFRVHIIGVTSPTAHQRAMIHSIDVALELFNNEFNGYPPSNALDPTDRPYCGAMKLCEAMMGQDLNGFHMQSFYRADGKDRSGTNLLYPESADPCNLKYRKGPFLPSESVYTHRLKDIYDDVGPFDGNTYVLCDVYSKTRHSGIKTGMPILYYKADTTKTKHNLENPDDPHNIYNYKDNYALLALGVPGEPKSKHPIFVNPKLFYEIFRSKKITTKISPYRADTYILLSAGFDGLYGTKDDIVNFDMRRK